MKNAIKRVQSQARLNYAERSILHEVKKTVTMILMVLASTMVGAQDLTHYKRVIKELSSAK